MRNLSFFILLMALGNFVFGQSLRYIQPREKRTSVTNVPKDLEPDVTSQSTQGTGVPFGTLVSDAVTAIKIGEASNFYTTLLPEAQALSVEPTVGSNGGSIAFIHRHNIGDCGGLTIDNGRLRYAISTDGGVSWNVGSPGISTAGNPPTQGCWGIGTINPLYTRAARHPSILLDDPKGTGNLEDLVISYTGPVLVDVATGFAGIVLRGSAVNATNNPTPVNVTEEEYFFGGQLYSLSMTERVPGEYWYVGPNYDGTFFTGANSLYKGLWDTANNRVNWTLVTSMTPSYFNPGFAGPAGGVRGYSANVSIGFDPEGKVGYVAGYGFLNGGVDSTIQLWMSESRNAGVTWSAPERFPFENFPDLADSLNAFFIDTVSIANPSLGLAVGDTVPDGLGIPSLQDAGVDLVVDYQGNPHVMGLIFDNFSHAGNGTYPGVMSNFAATNGGEMFYVDMTKDTAGNWQLLFLNRASNFWGNWGIAGDPDDEFSVWGDGQLTRSSDGELVFFHWTETPDTSSFFNDASNLLGVALDVRSQTMSPVTNWTVDDGNFGGSVLLPRTSQIALNTDTCSFTVPTVIADLDDGATLTQTNFWYFSDVTYNRCTFVDTPRYFFTCASTPIALTITETQPDCGTANGVLSASASGGQGTYAYEWDLGTSTASTASVPNLTAGVYSVSVTDERGCTSNATYTLSNVNAPVLSVDSIENISCDGIVDGSAFASITGGTAPFDFIWEHGELTQRATAIPEGTWQVIVEDANGCRTFGSVTIVEPDPLGVNANGVDVTCFGGNDGSLEAFAAGGTMPYNYAWSGNAGNAQEVFGVASDSFIVAVTDANGCVAFDTTFVSQPLEINLEVSGNFNVATQPPYDGALTATVVNAVPPIDFVWQILDSTLVDGTDTTLVWGDTVRMQQVDGNQATIADQLGNVLSCKFLVSITDANGCTSQQIGVVDTLPGFVGAVCPGVFVVDSTTANEKEFDGDISIFPNPAKNTIVVQGSLDVTSSFDITLYDMNGKAVLNKAVEPSNRFSKTLDVSNVSAGIYLMKVRTEKGVYTDKVMIMK